jgi:hypothetical protein
MIAKRSEIVEAILGFAVGIPSLLAGYSLLAGGCHLIGPDPPTYSCLSGSNFLSLMGFFLAPVGALAIVASVAVFVRRNH